MVKVLFSRKKNTLAKTEYTEETEHLLLLFPVLILLEIPFSICASLSLAFKKTNLLTYFLNVNMNSDQ